MSPSKSHKSPNFLIIVADDLGYSDVGPFGSEISTPSLDRLAKEGLRLTNFHTASACSPTRSMLFSGTDNHIAGLGQTTEHMQPQVDYKSHLGYEGYLNFRVAALSEILQDAGYYTCMSGKWHLGLSPETAPHARGFDDSFTFLSGCHNHYNYEPQLDEQKHGLFTPMNGGKFWMRDDKLDRVVPGVQFEENSHGDLCQHLPSDTGSNFSAVYGALFYRSLGTVNPFSINAGSSAINIAMVIVSQLTCDKVGRRPLMFIGTLVQTIGLCCVGGLGTIDDPSVSVRNGIMAAFVLFGAGFALGWAPLSHAIAAEVPTMKLRDKTYAIGCISNIVIQFAVAFSIPYLLYEPYAALGAKVGFIFGGLAFLCLFFTWFRVPDCAGKTLEEVDRLFLIGTPLRHFKRAKAPEAVEFVSVSALEKGSGDRT